MQTEPGLPVRPMSPSKEARQFMMQRVKGILIPLFSRLMEEKPADPKAFILQELQGQQADPEIVNWQIIPLSLPDIHTHTLTNDEGLVLL